MLVLRRKTDETIVIGTDILLRVLSIKGNAVRIGIEAPLEVSIRRAEILADAASSSLIDVMLDDAKRSA